MKICFIVPPNSTALADQIDPHLGLLCIAAAARERGHEVEYIEWALAGPLPSADVYALTAYGVNYRVAVDIARMCRFTYPGSWVVLGGPVASALPMRCLDDFDAVFIGEGESAFLEFLNTMETGRFYFRHYDPYVTGASPPPAYDLVDWSKYSRTVMGQRAFPLMTSRGCPYNCAFCSNDRHWGKFRAQPCSAVRRDIRYGKKITGYTAMQLWDSSFELCANRGYLDVVGHEDVTFFYQARGSAHGLDKEIYQAGGRVAFIGVETGDHSLLKRMRKRLTPDQIKDAVYRAQEAGISARCGLLFGFPGETPETLERTRRFVEEMKPDQVFLSFFVPFPGGDVWRNPAKYGVTWMAPWDQQRIQEKRGWVSASIETPWMSRQEWDVQAAYMSEWWKGLPRKQAADPSWWKDKEAQ